MREAEYRYVERVLYHHKDTEEKCAELAAEIDAMRAKGDARGQSYNACAGVHGGTSDPVARYVEEIMRQEKRLRRLARRVEAVEMLREDLRNGEVITVTSSRNLLRILEDYYLAGSTVMEFLRITRWVRSTFYVRRRELVMIAGEYLRA
ncbi:MAG: hypothetical protein IJG51_11915 [Synergistaceae bacterium]|nr:hypothetical protein [Synergistaceae bacterium]MBQ6665901.1 hypothetical protein [Synergistaceae bacterium]